MNFRFFTVFILAFLFSCQKSEEVTADKIHLECGAEHVRGGYFVENGHKFDNAANRSHEEARTGKYSVKLDSKHNYGFTHKIENVKAGDIITATVWRKSDQKVGDLVISAPEAVQYEPRSASFEEVDGWDLLKCEFIVNDDYEYVSIYVMNFIETPAYFDDLVIDHYINTSKPEVSDEKDILRVTIPESAMDSIRMFRDIAMKQEVISSDLKKYFNASIQVDGEEVPVSLRLKGDWTDHVEGSKWSFRIKVKGDNTYHGIKKFSIQNPTTRGYLMEWFAHKMFEKEDILTTRYDFKLVYINGENMGVYALEEHFDKRLLENRRRREGPIVRYDESGFWQAALHLKESKEPVMRDWPFLESSDITPFSGNRTFKSKSLHNQFLVARGMMDQYRKKDYDVEGYMELDKMAKFLAICDLLNTHHGLAWHNQRFYFNPITSRLEPIAYDCFTTPDLIIRRDPLLGLGAREEKTVQPIIDALFQNEQLEELYAVYLRKFSDENYIKSALKELDGELKAFQKLLVKEYPHYSFDENFFKLNCKNIREVLPEYNSIRKEQPVVTKGTDKVYNKESEPLLFDDAALKVHAVYADSLKCELSFKNFALADIEIFGYATKMNKNLIIPLKSSIKLAAYRNHAAQAARKFDFVPKYFFYRASNTGDSIIKAKVNKWPPLEHINPIGEVHMELPASINESSKTIVLKAGSYTFNKNVLVPQGYRLIIEKGTRIDLVKNAGFISYSPVVMKGSAQEPIVVTSSDKSASGFVVLSKGDTSHLSYVHFSQLNTMRDIYWTLTGAVSIHEGYVLLDHCTFKDNYCEDGLNLVRCNFVMKSCEVSNTFADGFDADFCTGKVFNSTFMNTGNDCIDFSGSTLEISGCTIKNSGDKGISGGERSQLDVKDCTIDHASIGVASKDKTIVKVSNTTIQNCTNGFAAYRKKAEYGPAEIFVEGGKLVNVKNRFLIELGSKVIYQEEEFIGEEKFDIDSMYMAFSK